MTRAAVPGLRTRYPLGETLPAVYAEDAFIGRFTDGLDAVLAPILSTMDNLPAYLAPGLAPADFVAWLGSWVAADLDDRWSDDRRRAVVAAEAAAHRWRGTPRGLVDRLRLYAGVRARVDDGPGATWSASPGSALEPVREVVVRVWSDEPVDLDRVRAVVAAACPTHVRWSVEVVDGEAS